MADKCLLDTNVLVYLQNEDSTYHLACRKKLEQLLKKGRELCITEQILREWLVVVTNPGLLTHPLSPPDAQKMASEMLVTYPLLESSDYSRLLLLELVNRYQLKGKIIHDANLVAVMLAHGVKHIFTYNKKDFKKFKEISFVL